MKRCMRFLTIILAISLCTNIAFASNVFSSTTGTNEEGAPLTEAAKKVVSEIEDLTDKINRGDFDENETVKGEIDNVRDHLNKLTSEERTHPEIVKAKADLDAVDPSIVITAGGNGQTNGTTTGTTGSVGGNGNTGDKENGNGNGANTSTSRPTGDSGVTGSGGTSTNGIGSTGTNNSSSSTGGAGSATNGINGSNSGSNSGVQNAEDWLDSLILGDNLIDGPLSEKAQKYVNDVQAIIDKGVRGEYMNDPSELAKDATAIAHTYDKLTSEDKHNRSVQDANANLSNLLRSVGIDSSGNASDFAAKQGIDPASLWQRSGDSVDSGTKTESSANSGLRDSLTRLSTGESYPDWTGGNLPQTGQNWIIVIVCGMAGIALLLVGYSILRKEE